jgi:hypothetical protein
MHTIHAYIIVSDEGQLGLITDTVTVTVTVTGYLHRHDRLTDMT